MSTTKPRSTPRRTRKSPVVGGIGGASSTLETDLSVQLKQLRRDIHFTQVELAPLLYVSQRTLASMEGGGKTVGSHELRAFSELKRLVAGLSEIMPANEVGKWLKTPNDAFGGFKPLELVDRGEVDRIYEMIYVLRAGIPG